MTVALVCGLASSTVLLGQRPSQPACDPGNGGLTLPPGFCAKVIADDLGYARNLAVAANGDLYVSIRTGARAPGQPMQPGYLMALRDTDGDGTMDQKERFGASGATGLVLRNGYLYFATPLSVERFKLTPGQLAPTGAAEVVVGGFPAQRGHQDKDIAFDDQGNLFVTVGLPSNACADPDRQPGAKGRIRVRSSSRPAACGSSAPTRRGRPTRRRTATPPACGKASRSPGTTAICTWR